MFDRFTDRARKVLSLARQEAERFNHGYIGTEHVLLGLVKEGTGVAANYIGTEHLLLGLTREHEGLAAQVVLILDLKLEVVRNEIVWFLNRKS